MARTERTIADVRRLFDELDDIELVATVCQLFCSGLSATMIRDTMLKDYGRKLTREEPYQLLQFAASHQWLKFAPPLEYAIAEQIREQNLYLEGAHVVHTRDLHHVAYQAAKRLLELVRKTALGRPEGSAVHVGLSGGRTVRLVVEEFAKRLRHADRELPYEIVFHAMVTGLQVDEPTTDPNTFFNYFLHDASMFAKTGFVALHGPTMPDRAMLRKLKKQRDVQEAFEKGDEIDIILTSGSSWSDHSQLKQLLEAHDPEGLGQLIDAGGVVDMLWQALGVDGPVKSRTQIQAMVLKDLDELPAMIRDGKKVLLVLGPCLKCGAPRADVLRTILHVQEPLVTHVVVDTRTASHAAIFGEEEVGEPGIAGGGTLTRRAS